MLPTLHKRCLSAVFAAFLGLLAAAPAHAASAPKIKAAYAVDGDRDGHVDGVSLKWSTRVRGGFDAKAPFAVSVRGYRVTKIDASRGKTSACTWRSARSATRAARYGSSSAASEGRSRSGQPAASAPPLPQARHAALRHPGAANDLAVTLDADRDARVDGVRVSYSREVHSHKQTKGRFLFSVAGYKIKTVNAARGRFFKIDLAEARRPTRTRSRRSATAGRRGRASGSSPCAAGAVAMPSPGPTAPRATACLRN